MTYLRHEIRVLHFFDFMWQDPDVTVNLVPIREMGYQLSCGVIFFAARVMIALGRGADVADTLHAPKRAKCSFMMRLLKILN